MPEVLNYLLFAAPQAVLPESSLLAVVPAYLDPGTGSLIIQIAVGVVVGGLATIKIFWKQFSAFIRNLFSGGSKNGRDEK